MNVIRKLLFLFAFSLEIQHTQGIKLLNFSFKIENRQNLHHCNLNLGLKGRIVNRTLLLFLEMI